MLFLSLLAVLKQAGTPGQMDGSDSSKNPTPRLLLLPCSSITWDTIICMVEADSAWDLRVQHKQGRTCKLKTYFHSNPPGQNSVMCSHLQPGEPRSLQQRGLYPSTILRGGVGHKGSITNKKEKRLYFRGQYPALCLLLRFKTILIILFYCFLFFYLF